MESLLLLLVLVLVELEVGELQARGRGQVSEAPLSTGSGARRDRPSGRVGKNAATLIIVSAKAPPAIGQRLVRHPRAPGTVSSIDKMLTTPAGWPLRSVCIAATPHLVGVLGAGHDAHPVAGTVLLEELLGKVLEVLLRDGEVCEQRD